MSPIIAAVLTVEALDGREAGVKLLIELIEELTRICRVRESTSKDLKNE